MKVLVTGAGGFIGRNLVAHLECLAGVETLCCGRDTPQELLEAYCGMCDFVFHLAGVNRPQHPQEFMEGNAGFTAKLIQMLRDHSNCCPFCYASSIQAGQDHPYGRSKKAGEELVSAYGRKEGVRVVIYRFPNIFGKWCRPDYNSVIATFCHRIARGLPVQVHDRSTKLQLAYIDDVIKELVRAMNGQASADADGYGVIRPVYEKTLGETVDLIRDFREGRDSLMLPDQTQGSFEKKLYSTYVSYLPADACVYPLRTHTDERGSFTEMLKSADRGQVSVNLSEAGVTKGNHWHHTKTEKFLVVSGQGVISLRRHGSSETVTYPVSGHKPQIVEIPPGYVHAITNVGDTKLVTVIWCSECFDEKRPDTIYEMV